MTDQTEETKDKLAEEMKEKQGQPTPVKTSSEPAPEGQCPDGQHWDSTTGRCEVNT